jgi:hypothetical protein
MEAWRLKINRWRVRFSKIRKTLIGSRIRIQICIRVKKWIGIRIKVIVYIRKRNTFFVKLLWYLRIVYSMPAGDRFGYNNLFFLTSQFANHENLPFPGGQRDWPRGRTQIWLQSFEGGGGWHGAELGLSYYHLWDSQSLFILHRIQI